MGFWPEASPKEFSDDYFVKILNYTSESQDISLLKKALGKESTLKAVNLLKFLQSSSYNFKEKPIICNAQMKICKGHEVVALAKKLGEDISYIKSNKKQAFDYNEEWAKSVLTKKELRKLEEKPKIKEDFIVEEEEKEEEDDKFQLF